MELSFKGEFTLMYEGELSLKPGLKLVMELSYWLRMLESSKLKMSFTLTDNFVLWQMAFLS